MYTHTVAELGIPDKVTKAAPEYGRATVKLVEAAVVDLPVQDNRVTEMQAEQVARALPYWDLT
jgi:hypothetical protein